MVRCNKSRLPVNWNGCLGIALFLGGIFISNALTPTSLGIGEGNTKEPTKLTIEAATEGVCECGTKSPEILNESSVGIGGLTFEISNTNSYKKSESAAIKPQPFVVNGEDTVRGEIPWMVAITKYQHNKLPRWRVVCGGAVISQRYVITAAHCLVGKYKDTLEAVFNVENVTTILQDSKVIRRKIKRIIIHPEYYKQTVDNDIALIELAVPLDFSSKHVSRFVRPVCIPTTTDEAFYSNKSGVVSGWGKTEVMNPEDPVKIKGENSDHLKKLTVPILSREDCLKTGLPSKNNVTENMICAGYVEGGSDACVNDSGGPLTVEHGGRSYIVGVVSWGWGCAQKNYPGVYTNIGRYTSWIQSNTQGQGCGRIA